MDADAKPAGPEGMTVLVAEDYDSARKAFCLIVRSLGASAVGAANGEEALRLAQAHKPDVIFCDIRMPSLDGFEVLARLRALPELRAIPVIAMSGSGSEADLDRIASAGFFTHLVKPVLPSVIEEQLRRIGARRRSNE
jgi:CheY-like chemotaxis protein